MKTFNYFAYGSNMDKDDLDKWCIDHNHPIIEFLDVEPARLYGYKLCFNYFSKSRKAGAANLMITSKEYFVDGLLIKLNDDAKKIIRKKENYPYSYNEYPITVETFKGELIKNALTYKVIKSREEKEHKPPTKYYMNLIIKNAKKYGFHLDYIKYLESLETKEK